MPLSLQKKNRGIWKGTSQIIELKVTKNVVGNGFLKIFCSVKWLQHLLEGLNSSSDKLAPESISSVWTDIFRIESFDKTFSKKALLFSALQGFLIPQYGVLFVFFQIYKFLPGSCHFIFYLVMDIGEQKTYDIGGPHQNLKWKRT